MRNLTRTLRPDFLQRSSGILLHVTSLPGPHGCGDLGAEAHRFLEFLAESGQGWWQMLPIGPPGRAPGWSPYDSASASAGSPWLVSLTSLSRQGLLPPHELKPPPGLASRRVNFVATLRYRRLRDSFGLAPMRLFQFGFGTEADSVDHLPHNYSQLCAAYPGNHDNDTTVGWFQGLPASKRRRVQAYMGGHPSTIHHDTLRALFASPASLVIFPLQDLLGLDSRARMNVPGTVGGNWNWRLESQPPAATAKTLRSLTEMFGRCPAPRRRGENPSPRPLRCSSEP
jgi:4-alpha-glucanotransferase